MMPSFAGNMWQQPRSSPRCTIPTMVRPVQPQSMVTLCKAAALPLRGARPVVVADAADDEDLASI